MCIRDRFLRSEDAERDGEHTNAFIAANQERPQIFVPLCDQDDDTECQHRWPANRKDDAPEDFEVPCSVQVCGVLKLTIDSEEELAEKEDGERRHKKRRSL